MLFFVSFKCRCLCRFVDRMSHGVHGLAARRTIEGLFFCEGQERGCPGSRGGAWPGGHSEDDRGFFSSQGIVFLSCFFERRSDGPVAMRAHSPVSPIDRFLFASFDRRAGGPAAGRTVDGFFPCRFFQETIWSGQGRPRSGRVGGTPVPVFWFLQRSRRPPPSKLRREKAFNEALWVLFSGRTPWARIWRSRRVRFLRQTGEGRARFAGRHDPEPPRAGGGSRVRGGGEGATCGVGRGVQMRFDRTPS